MKQYEKIKKKLLSKTIPTKFEWIILGIILLIPFCIYCYIDTKSIILYQVNFIDALFHGKIFDYYQFTYNNILSYRSMGYSVAFNTYDMPLNTVLGIWGIPLYFIWKVRGINILSSSIALFYGKSLLLVFLVFASVLIYKLCIILKVNKIYSKWASYIFASSLLVFTAIGFIGQCDIIGIVFILKGLIAYIKSDDKKFILWFMVAIACKQYALFIFLPLLLLKEKRIIFIALKTLLAISFTYIYNFPFLLKNNIAITNKSNFAQTMFNKLTYNKINLSYGNVSILVLLFGILCIYCYLKKLKENENDKYAIFIPLLAMVIVFISFPSSPYWYIHLIPYLTVMIVYNSKNMKNLMLFETLGIICLTLENYYRYFWCYDISGTKNYVFSEFFGNISNTKSLSFETFVSNGFLKNFNFVFISLFVVFMLAFVYECLPNKIKKDDDQPIRLYSLTRLLINFLIICLPIGIYFYNIFVY